MNITNSPIIPLPIFLLPNGMSRLRIVEPRYLKMVRIAYEQQGFVIKKVNNQTQVSDPIWGSWVQIINFHQGKDGILELDVQCQSLVTITSIEEDADNLQFGNIVEQKHWSQELKQIKRQTLSKPLYDLINKDALLAELYPYNAKPSENWVVARWLELLPVNLHVKETFIKQDFEQARQFVESIILQE
ncbi:LON peptidase substrate-binding domain-containing protein [uncultured Paraglaciecola sp.]|mgnify:CR=1 FL=1|uniref:LON peptidase substrate-binding domain-containing protein n=1 Tax=uncultured Paraglaciecola sp. TaxID=1765024 RepID=UPI002635680F|nr:LON peptidase substrate-binding domain-containing protein [uncultured Paraglaciecola sp.]